MTEKLETQRMTRKLLTVDEFRGFAGEDVQTDCRILRAMPGEPLQDEANPDVFRFTCSDESVDLSSDVIKQSGWTNLKEFEGNNGVALWAHDSSEPPIGRWKNLAVIAGKLKGDLHFISEDIYPFAGMLAKMVRGGFLNAVSVGFAPLKWEFSKDKNRPAGLDFLQQILLEISLCPVPCNQNALIDARSAGIDTGPLSEWAEKILDGEGRISLQRSFVEELFRQAKTPRVTRQKYLAKSETSDWKLCPSSDLPVVEAKIWEPADAAKRMLDAAGFDTDAPDTAKAAQGFLIHDAANPLLRSSYSLPFADIIDGELKAVKLGVAASMGRIDQTDATAEVREEAKQFAEQLFQKEVSTITPLVKAGRKISSTNEALLMKAMEHHASASQCIKDVLGSSTPDGDDPEETPDSEPDDNTVPTVVVLSEADMRKQRIADRLEEAKALRASAKR